MAKITKEKAGKVYDLLVGAYEPDRDNFIYHHTESKDGCSEWRFCGKLGFGGKYRTGYKVVGKCPIMVGCLCSDYIKLY